MEKIFSYKIEVRVTREGGNRDASDDALLKKFERQVSNIKVNNGNSFLSVKNLRKNSESEDDFSDDSDGNKKLFVEGSENYYLKVRKRLKEAR